MKYTIPKLAPTFYRVRCISFSFITQNLTVTLSSQNHNMLCDSAADSHDSFQNEISMNLSLSLSDAFAVCMNGTKFAFVLAGAFV